MSAFLTKHTLAVILPACAMLVWNYAFASSVDVEQVRAEIKSREIERTIAPLTHVEKNIIQRLLSPLMGDNDPIELFLGIPKRKDDGTFSWLLEGNDAYIKIGEFTPYDFKEMMTSSVSIYGSGEECALPIFFKISKNGYILELHLYKERYHNVLICDSEDWVTFYAPSLHERIIKIMENKYNLSQRP